MNHRRWVIVTVLSLYGLPVLMALGEAVSFYRANRDNGAFMAAGLRREYVLYVPKRYDRAKPAPLVISMHAAALWGAAQRETSQWDRVADREGFLVVYPSAVRGSGPRIWHADRDPGPEQDVAFISDLIDTLAASYNIDPTRIYANGLSNGGGMAFVLSCLLPERIAAVGLVGAAQTLPWNWCPDHDPVPMIAFHGTADSLVPYTGGSVWLFPGVVFPDVSIWTAKWAARNRCAPRPVDSAVARDVTRREYGSCAGDAAVVLYTINGGGHTWPGGTPLPEWWVGPTSQSIDASSVMWSFFREHPLKRN